RAGDKGARSSLWVLRAAAHSRRRPLTVEAAPRSIPNSVWPTGMAGAAGSVAAIVHGSGLTGVALASVLASVSALLSIVVVASDWTAAGTRAARSVGGRAASVLAIVE